MLEMVCTFATNKTQNKRNMCYSFGKTLLLNNIVDIKYTFDEYDIIINSIKEFRSVRRRFGVGHSSDRSYSNSEYIGYYRLSDHALNRYCEEEKKPYDGGYLVLTKKPNYITAFELVVIERFKLLDIKPIAVQRKTIIQSNKEKAPHGILRLKRNKVLSNQ